MEVEPRETLLQTTSTAYTSAGHCPQPADNKHTRLAPLSPLARDRQLSRNAASGPMQSAASLGQARRPSNAISILESVLEDCCMHSLGLVISPLWAQSPPSNRV
ncbi:hypothetical protein GGP41_002658 [Bipolaris sorokiniana]|uniref:Uncharacterized protein n=1 Tax=Cochliobolus sativus TaxID=45130 RepID=A0A8H5ZMG0_COCSA|nr:hypothetical protein GGP41_002658 [Bipolaris sorokiniana]